MGNKGELVRKTEEIKGGRREMGNRRKHIILLLLLLLSLLVFQPTKTVNK